jgi:threonine/homoserine/homoserine lactone efflux protein
VPGISAVRDGVFSQADYPDLGIRIGPTAPPPPTCSRRQAGIGENSTTNTSLFGTYLVTVTVLMLTPGPDMLFCLATGLRSGPRAGFLAALGAASGEVVHITASAVGLAALFRAAPPLFEAVRIAGACYLVLLGIRALRHRNEGIGGASTETRTNRAYARGFVTNLLNPKMALFSIAFLPQFVDPHAGSIAFQFVVLGACFVALELAVDGTVGLLAGRIKHLLRGRRARRNLNVAAGSVFLGLGARVALER